MSLALPDGMTINETDHGLARIDVSIDACSASVYLLGAHVSHWQPRGHEPVLFMSRRSRFEVGKPIRGGVPVCFPWFAGNSPKHLPPGGAGGLAAHGLVRQALWSLTTAERSGDGSAMIELTGPGDLPGYPGVQVLHRIEFGTALRMNLQVLNRGGEPVSFEEALHTYFSVSDVRQVTLHGLESATYLDTAGGKRATKTQDDQPIRFTGETDRIYTGNTSTCVIDDPGLDRRITIAKSNANTTVVWNPHTEKSRRMDDFGDDEWPNMLCVETANAASDAVTLAAGGQHEMTAELSVDVR